MKVTRFTCVVFVQVSTDPISPTSDTRLNKSDIAEANLPPQDVLYKLVDRIESLLPKDDHVKYDSRARKLDWNKVAFDDLSGQDCQRIWGHIQERIRRFRIMVRKS